MSIMATLGPLHSHGIIDTATYESMMQKKPSSTIAAYELLSHNNITADKITKTLAMHYNIPIITMESLPWDQIGFDLQYQIHRHSMAYYNSSIKQWIILIYSPIGICEAENLAKRLQPRPVINYLNGYHWCLLVNKITHHEVTQTINNQNNISIESYQQHINDYAIIAKASDIHYERHAEKAGVRLRVDGQLHHLFHHTPMQHGQLVSRLKLISHLDISECRRPQDAGLKTKSSFGHERESRLSITPTIYGEKAVLRLLNTDQSIPTIPELGLHDTQHQLLQNKLQQHSGLILVTGPTGSGKSTTLYSIIQHLKHLPINIVTAEDPVELAINGITQIPTKHNIGLDFATILRSVLRQDPDVIMIGEMRDRETAEIAIQAANTGHLVLSTLHTNDTISSINRLLHMGIAGHQLDCLQLILSQRLLASRCRYCKNNPDQQKCARCHNGYLGRTAVFEVLSQEHISVQNIQQKSTTESRAIAMAAGMLSMQEHIRIKQQEGMID